MTTRASKSQPAFAGEKQVADGKFKPGQSGNPNGKNPGTRSAASRLAEQLMEHDLPEVVAAVIKAAREGDIAAARIVLDRIAPVRRGRTVEIKIPAITNEDSVGHAFEAVFRALGSGTITIAESRSLAELIEIRARAIPVTAPDEHAEFRDAKANLLAKLGKMHERYVANIERQKTMSEPNTDNQNEDVGQDDGNDSFGESIN